MGCASYEDPRLAAVYDPLNPPGPAHDFYRAMAGASPRRILDMGCGTGRLACALAADGHRVTGADPAASMLAIARCRPGGETVAWIEVGAVELSIATRFDLIVMTGHAFQVLLEDAEILAALGNLRRHLAPGGRLAFETRNPAVREWDSWRPDATREHVAVPGLGLVEVEYDVVAETGDLVTFETRFRFPDGSAAAAPHTLRFTGRNELTELLRKSGFGETRWHGGWDGAGLTAASPEIIVIASGSNPLDLPRIP
jgi:SAM-dependent methyltransferase